MVYVKSSLVSREIHFWCSLKRQGFPAYTMKAYEGVEVLHHPSLSSALIGSDHLHGLATLLLKPIKQDTGGAPEPV